MYVSSQRFLKKVQDDFEAEEDGRLVLYIDGRSPGSDLTTPKQISKTLRNQTMSDNFLRFIKKVRPSVSSRYEQNVGPDRKYIQEAALNFKGSEEDLRETLAGFEKIFKYLKKLPQKPVIVLGKYLQQKNNNTTCSRHILC
jgi:hypothetical protein